MYITEQIINEITESVVNEILGEARRKTFPKDGSVPKNKGRRPTRLKSRKKQFEEMVKPYDLTTKRYSGSIEEVLKMYASVASTMGGKLICDNGTWVDQPETENGATKGRQYNIRITFNDGMLINGAIMIVGYGTQDDPLSEFETQYWLSDKLFKADDMSNEDEQA